MGAALRGCDQRALGLLPPRLRRLQLTLLLLLLALPLHKRRLRLALLLLLLPLLLLRLTQPVALRAERGLIILHDLPQARLRALDGRVTQVHEASRRLCVACDERAEGPTHNHTLLPAGSNLTYPPPTQDRAKALERRGLSVPPRVVIKAFDLGYGSTIPQIVRESRSLDAAKNLGLIL